MSQDTVQNYYFTFGVCTNKGGNYIKIEGTAESTRKKMVAVHGLEWAFQYNEADFDGQAERFGLTEIPL